MDWMLAFGPTGVAAEACSLPPLDKRCLGGRHWVSLIPCRSLCVRQHTQYISGIMLTQHLLNKWVQSYVFGFLINSIIAGTLLSISSAQFPKCKTGVLITTPVLVSRIAVGVKLQWLTMHVEPLAQCLQNMSMHPVLTQSFLEVVTGHRVSM